MKKLQHSKFFDGIKTAIVPGLFASVVALTSFSGNAFSAEITVYKSPWCGCCTGWAEYMKKNGHNVTVKKTEQMEMIKKMAGVPEDLQACHTALIGKYVVEGHVPNDAVKRLLSEKPKAYGISAPGMPAGSPGMEGPDKEAYNVILFKSGGKREIYGRY